ncbi:hypothetical protein [Xenorhabdus szentirmaii]|uniref:Uncharacterized protein n=1 Tax=Xenorhabdus szentirmaii DSM 16338 TaxID=1427518 RepID=W1J6H5_9GAMM|nr:hypothetical protein [Xenorhabdus szentirmaii]PHM34278.1 hypothetical protein Xsze_00697 [Xenorhabdus szentirmaii DSM 16338]PHM43007.1 hypothetical protein Xszus_02780 [Xenorhabdus szentirmaii]CDL85648.1 conserved hypothetical protein [Xenorhabdus szentirmaii DSM 16338]
MMQQKNCFFCSFAHKTLTFDDFGYFFKKISSNNKQEDLITKESLNTFGDFFLQISPAFFLFVLKKEIKWSISR